MMSMVRHYYSDTMIEEEIINNGVLKALKHISSFGFKGSFEGWLRRIMYHSISDYSKVQNKYRDNVVLMEKDALIPKQHSHNLYYKDLLNLVEELPEATRVVFNLFVIEDYSH